VALASSGGTYFDREGSVRFGGPQAGASTEVLEVRPPRSRWCQWPDVPVTIVLPEVIPHHLWEQPLHNQLGFAIKLALLGHPGVVVTSVPVRVSE